MPTHGTRARERERDRETERERDRERDRETETERDATLRAHARHAGEYPKDSHMQRPLDAPPLPRPLLSSGDARDRSLSRRNPKP